LSKKRIRVVAALIESTTEKGAYLVQQRLPDKSRANLWEFPGGKVEAGETDQQALARECKEELDVELEVGAKEWGVEHEYSDLIVALELYRAKILSGEPKALGAQALKFATPKVMRSMPFCEADLPLLEALDK
jgi:8-oxo-dGTP diphosphatase